MKNGRFLLFLIILTAALLLVIPGAMAATSYLSIENSTYCVAENSTLNVTIQRSGDLTNLVGCSFHTLNGSALQGDDYLPSIGSVTFLSGDENKTIKLYILNNSTYTGNRSFYFEISQPVGESLLLINNSTVNIIEDQKMPFTPPPKEDNMSGVPDTLLYICIIAVFVFLILSFIELPFATPVLKLYFRIVIAGLVIALSWIVNIWLTSGEVEYSIAAGFLLCRAPELAYLFVFIVICEFLLVLYQIVNFAVDDVMGGGKRKLM
ncbi:Calx-beta domain-containing protein [Methanocella sp. MCL-LM]|uniref:Calx-beta domain-containing protein n=1 Tax=Methanocella sp. MCL-LM TaxID=3412035 RepID=UPI003C75C2E0